MRSMYNSIIDRFYFLVCLLFPFPPVEDQSRNWPRFRAIDQALSDDER